MHNAKPSKKPKLVIFKGPYYAVLDCRSQAAIYCTSRVYIQFLPNPNFIKKFNSSEQNDGDRN